MNINLIDENTYELLNDKGEQVEQGAITQEWRDKAKKDKKHVRQIIAAAKKVKVEAPIMVPVEGETVIVVPPHEHETDDRYALFDHAHPLEEHDHEHTHPGMAVLQEALEAESRNRYAADQKIEAKYSVHMHPELAQAFHTHEDIYASLNILRGMVTAVEGLIPKETQAHQHNDLSEAISTLRSEVTSLRNSVTSLETRISDALSRAVVALRAELAGLQPAGDYLTRDEINPLTQGKRTYRLKVKSEQNVNGAKHLTVEEV